MSNYCRRFLKDEGVKSWIEITSFVMTIPSVILPNNMASNTGLLWAR